jgi:UDP-glucose 4-epimerase
MSLKNKSVLVTGGAGFIGSHLVDRLVADEPECIVVADNMFLGKEENLKEAKSIFPMLKILKQDVTDYKGMKTIMEAEGTQVVFNLAVIPLLASIEKPAWTFTHNNEMTLAICELARHDCFDTLIHFSSSEAYGTSVSGPMDENHPLNGTTPYAASKAACDLLVFSYCQTFGLDASIIRPFNNYGPRQNEQSYAGVIPLTIRRILENEPPVVFGDGKQTRDYLYVTDTASAAVKIYDCKNTRNRVLNIASGKEVSIEYLIGLIAKCIGYKGIILHEPDRPADVRRHIANIYLAEDLIDFKQTIKFEDGLKRTVEWYKENMRRQGVWGK